MGFPLAAALCLAGCETDEAAKGVKVDYAADADANLTAGEKAFESKNYLEAERYFEYVRGKYPFLEASKTAALRMADLEFDRESYLAARDAYRNFAKAYPTHPKVDYAAFRAALTYYKDIPSDFFLLPPSRQKDQADVRGTLSAMEEFIRSYPKSSYLEEARKYAAEAQKRLAEHELSVARFYRREERWQGVVSRLQTVVSEYPNLGFDEEAYFGLHEAYSKLKDEAQAKAALRQLIDRLPGTEAAAKAKRLLGEG